MLKWRSNIGVMVLCLASSLLEFDFWHHICPLPPSRVIAEHRATSKSWSPLGVAKKNKSSKSIFTLRHVFQEWVGPHLVILKKYFWFCIQAFKLGLIEGDRNLNQNESLVAFPLCSLLCPPLLGLFWGINGPIASKYSCYQIHQHLPFSPHYTLTADLSLSNTSLFRYNSHCN